jgi:hypothetical protein
MSEAHSMSSLLVASGCDLGDEREVLRTLRAADYVEQSTSIAGSIASLVALVLFISTAAMWSAILCGARSARPIGEKLCFSFQQSNNRPAE